MMSSQGANKAHVVSLKFAVYFFRDACINFRSPKFLKQGPTAFTKFIQSVYARVYALNLSKLFFQS